MRFVETKTPEQQSCVMLHRPRQLFIRQRTSVMPSGVTWPGSASLQPLDVVEQLLAIATDASDQRVTELRGYVAALALSYGR
jgi:transposase